MLRLSLFGAPRLERDGQPQPLRRTKALALLAYLAVTGRPHERDTLLGLLWPEFDEASARNNLRRELSLLRGLLGDELLLSEGQQLALRPHPALWLDLALFRERLDEARRLPAGAPERAEALRAAVALAGDELLAGFSLPESAPFEEWLFFQREALRQQLAEALAALVAWHGERGSHGEAGAEGTAQSAIGYARRWVALDPLHEPAQRELMRSYALAGQHSAALRQYESCAQLLAAELGAAPEAETRALYEAVRARRLGAPQPPAPAFKGGQKMRAKRDKRRRFSYAGSTTSQQENRRAN